MPQYDETCVFVAGLMSPGREFSWRGLERRRNREIARYPSQLRHRYDGEVDFAAAAAAAAAAEAASHYPYIIAFAKPKTSMAGTSVTHVSSTERGRRD
ncbi:hypothetical protein CH63R_09013 [Colletotrichum higginsianum IMI 349063]|uniref:Uncharacterized protein n=1 Tax=Colletotrichum higginsianum (strain IMI 349063) TaxID=759273 RepID=A0A1B7Y663_COLHI|nr:hypothetical protein CH63R_09013 [Colletotrichum higginsianum IMI 349063]OBR07492.1 hypothetical protein CH63R_09013 [Colletotrichum higginsianum IMI 349063]